MRLLLKKSNNRQLGLGLLQKIYPDVLRRCYGSRQRNTLKQLIDEMKEKRGVTQDVELTADDLKEACRSVQSRI